MAWSGCGVLGQLRFGVVREIVEEDVRHRVALAQIRQARGIGRPGYLRLRTGRVRHPECRAAIARRRGEHLAVRDQRHFAAVCRKRQVVELSSASDA